MSTEISTERRTAGFGERLAEAFGTTKPAQIAKKLGVTYQAAKNYLDGRVPGTDILIKISDSTGHSIHWLLTGVGEKSVPVAGDAKVDLIRRVELIERKLSLEDREFVEKLVQSLKAERS